MLTAVIAMSRSATSRSPPEPTVEAAAAMGSGVWDRPRGRLRAGLSGVVRPWPARSWSRATGRAPYQGSWAMWTNTGASLPAVLSTLPRTAGGRVAVVRGRRRPRRLAQAPSRTVRLRRTGRSPHRTEPSAVGLSRLRVMPPRTPSQLQRSAVPRLSASTSTPTTITSRERASRRPAEASRISLQTSTHAPGRLRVLRPRLRERELQHDDLGGGGGARVVDTGTDRPSAFSPHVDRRVRRS